MAISPLHKTLWKGANMITRDGNEIAVSDPYRHKYDGALCEWVYDHIELWSDGASGDSESTIGWFAQIGKRLLRGDSQGFVWLEKYGNEHEASMIVRALRHFDSVWSADERSEDPEFEAFSMEHDSACMLALDYVEYSYACDAESCDPLTYGMWSISTPKGPVS